MAVKIWVSTDGDWSNANSWSPAAVPVHNTDSAYFPAGSQSVTSGLAQSTVNLLGIETDADYTGDIGASGGPLQITSDIIYHRGSGTLYHEDLKDGMTNNESTDVIVINSTGNSTNAAVLSGTSTDILLVYNGGITCSTTTVSKFMTAFDPRLGMPAVSTIAMNTNPAMSIILHGNVTFGPPSGFATTDQIILLGGNVDGNTLAMGDLFQFGGTFEPPVPVTITDGIALYNDIILAGGILDMRGHSAIGYGPGGSGTGPTQDVIAVNPARVYRRQDQTNELMEGGDKYVEPGVVEVRRG